MSSSSSSRKLSRRSYAATVSLDSVPARHAAALNIEKLRCTALFAWRSLIAAALLYSLGVSIARADIIVDPFGTGATDVYTDAGPLVNPLPDPLDLDTESIVIGGVSDGALAVTDGSALYGAELAYIALNAGAHGNLVVRGAGSNVSFLFPEEGENQYYINAINFGYLGHGDVNVMDGGALVTTSTSVARLEGSTANVNIVGTGSRWTTRWLFAGFRRERVGGTAEISVLAGGTLNTEIASISTRSNVKIDGLGANWRNANTIVVGDGSDGSLLVQNGGSVATSALSIGQLDGYIGDDVPASVVTVDGFGSRIDAIYGIVVGREMHGRLEIRNGATVSSRDSEIASAVCCSTGVVNVAGFGSAWHNSGELSVGEDGAGELNVSGGANVFNSHGFVGRRFGSSGVATIDGFASRWTNNGDLTIGDVGEGALHVSGGGVVSNYLGVLGADPGSTGTAMIDGAGSQWVNTGYLYVGDEGTGSLTIQNGAEFLSAVGFNSDSSEYSGSIIGHELGANGNVTIDGTNSRWSNSNVLFIGYSGSGTLTVQNGGVYTNIDPDGGVGVGAAHHSDGTLIVDGGGSRLETASGLSVGNFSRGELIIRNGAEVHSATGFVASRREDPESALATITGHGSIWRVDERLSLARHFYGTLEILDQAAVTSETFHQYQNGVLSVEIGDAFPVPLQVDETMTIFDGATLEFALDDAVIPTVGAAFTIATAGGGVDGEFSRVNLVDGGDGYRIAWDIHYNPTDITVEIVSAILDADFDEDGDVDADDFLAWQAGFGATGSISHVDGDANNDGAIDGDDFLIWQAQFGLTAGQAAGYDHLFAQSAVPEPGAIMVMLLGILTVVAINRSARGVVRSRK